MVKAFSLVCEVALCITILRVLLNTSYKPPM